MCHFIYLISIHLYICCTVWLTFLFDMWWLSILCGHSKCNFQSRAVCDESFPLVTVNRMTFSNGREITGCITSTQRQTLIPTTPGGASSSLTLAGCLSGSTEMSSRRAGSWTPAISWPTLWWCFRGGWLVFTVT